VAESAAMAVGGRPGNGPEEEEPSSDKLERNMKAAGVKRPPGTALHHIVAGRAGPAAQARAILRKLGVGINDTENGVYLPCNSTTPCDEPGALHSTLHTEAYYRAVNDALRGATTREQVLAILRGIAERLEAGGYP